MATSKALDPSTTRSASEAFHQPLPQVRQFHRSLTSALDDKNERLRILVGGSYRQLLGTAETILQMRKDVEGVEDNLSRVGNGCGRAVVGKMVGGLGKLEREIEEGSMGARREEMSWIARMKVLAMCGVIVAGLLRRGVADGQGKKGKSLVLAAKVLVLSRLLAKNLIDAPSARMEEKSSAEEARKKMGKLRSRLLRAIERTLEKVGEGVEDGSDREDLLQALCAYSLVTNSGAKDVLRHFLHVRADALTLSFEDEVDKRDPGHGILKALRLYTRTLLDVQALAPRRLAEALASLKTKPLLKDETIRVLEGLRLDVCERWFSDEVLYFTPYVRHDDLEGPQAVETLKGWSKKASEVLLSGFEKTLQKTLEFKTVVDLRTKTLEVWIKDGGKARGFDPSVVLDGLRKVINERMFQLVESRVGKLHLVGTEIEATLGAWRGGITDRYASLWDEQMLEMETSNGASLFKQSILTRSHGKNDAISKAVAGYQTWRHLIDEVANILEQLKKQRWDDDLEDIEDDLSLESRQDLLSKDDPQMLQDRLDASLERSFTELHNKISSLLTAHKDSEDIGEISIYTLRVLRSIRNSLPENEALKTFGLSLVPLLHDKLASAISLEAVDAFSGSFAKKRVAGRALWEGAPELPIQPSPATFKFLHGLSRSMAESGGDLWSPSAVEVLKRHLRGYLGRTWIEAVRSQEALGKEAVKVNGNSTRGEGEGDAVEESAEVEAATQKTSDPEKQKEVLIQTLFDILVLQSFLAVSAPTAEDDLERLEQTVEAQLDLESSTKKRLELSAKEYWKRTNLLFGLLA